MTALAEQIVDAGQLAMQTSGEIIEYLEGRAVPFDTWADVGLYLESHKRDSFTATLARKWKLPLLAFHKSDQMPIGISESWESRPDGLWGRWKIAPSAVAQESARWARDGGMGLSIGFQPQQSEWQMAKDWDPMQGPDHMDKVTRVRSRLLEVSLTPTPAFEDSIVDTVHATSLDGSDRSLIAEYRGWMRAHRYARS